MAKLTRRTFLSSGAGLLFLSIVPTGEAYGTPQFVAVRIWPASSYTRATLESTRPLQHKYFLLDNPRRLVVDIQGASLDSVVQSLPQKLSRSDPYVAGIRVGQLNQLMKLLTEDFEFFTNLTIKYSARKAIVHYYQTKGLRDISVNDVYIGQRDRKSVV